MADKNSGSDEQLTELLETLSGDWHSLKVNAESWDLIEELCETLKVFKASIAPQTWGRVALVLEKLGYIISLESKVPNDSVFVGSAHNKDRRSVLNDIIGLLTDDSDGPALPAAIATELRQSSGRPTFDVEVPGGQTVPISEQVRALKPR